MRWRCRCSCPAVWPHAGLPYPLLSPRFVQIHVHWISDNIQPSHPLPPPSFAFSLSQHQGLFQWVSSSHQVAKGSVLPMNIQSWFSLGLIGLISLQSKGLSKVFSRTTIWKHQFFSTQLCLWPNSHIHTWLVVSGKTIVLIIQTFVSKVMYLLFNTLSLS